MTLAYILILALAVFCLYLLSRIGDLEERLGAVQAELRASRRRAPVVVPLPRTERAPEEVPDLPTATPPPLPIREIPPPVPVPQAETPLRMPEPVTPPGPNLSERLRQVLGDQEWETIVGGSLLNKLGALILVIGIALFLGFSFGYMNPAGRAAIAFVISAGILGAGVWFERRQRYQVFARGLIGAGWAALYATAYAAYAIPEARIIENPFLGSMVLLLVAAGMIGHSLRYHAQAVTGVAYFAAFAALAATPSSPFAVVSLIPLAGSILYLAIRFDWYSMAVFGLAATYLTCISRGDSNAPLAETQSLFLIYWLLFEAFDLLRTRRGFVHGGVEWLYPGNLAGFLGLSYLSWLHHAPQQLWLASAVGSVLFLADSVTRGLIRPRQEDLPESLRQGGYQSSAFVSAVLGGLAIVGRVPGLWMSAGLAAEAEVLYLAGVRLRSSFLRRLGTTAFINSLARLFWGQPVGKSELLGHNFWNQTPPAALHVAFFYLNRTLRREAVLMSSAAAVLAAGLLAAEIPSGFVGMAWMLAGAVLFEAGLRCNALDFRIQSYALLAAGAVVNLWPGTAATGLGVSLVVAYAFALRSRWIIVSERDEVAWGSAGAAVTLAAMFLWRTVPYEYVALAWCALAVMILEAGRRRLPQEFGGFFIPGGVLAFAGVIVTHSNDFAKFPPQAVWITWFGAAALAGCAALRTAESPDVRDSAAGIGIVAAIAGVWLVVPDPYVSVVWTLFGLAILETGNALALLRLRRLALLALAAAYYRSFAFDLEFAPLRAMPVTIAGLYAAWFRLREELAGRTIFWIAVIPLLALIQHEAGFAKAPLGWMAVAVLLLLAGVRFGLRTATFQSYAIAALSFAFAIWFSSPWWISGGVVAGLYAGQFLSKPLPEQRAQIWFSVGGSLLLAAILYQEISGGLLTVSLGLEGLLLLAGGFGVRERVLRLQGLALLLLCILKLFIYDLRNLETLYRILSFVALGLILLAVSWIYTRFREQLQKLL